MKYNIKLILYFLYVYTTNNTPITKKKIGVVPPQYHYYSFQNVHFVFFFSCIRGSNGAHMGLCCWFGLLDHMTVCIFNRRRRSKRRRRRSRGGLQLHQSSSLALNLQHIIRNLCINDVQRVACSVAAVHSQDLGQWDG